jgi:Ni/Fe-hydrogenase 1 B-type cytochrome subunit
MGLTSLNVWLDAAFVVLYVAVVAFLAFHFLMFVKTGRFRKSFIEGHWPEHDHVPPATPKVLHFTHMTSMIILGVTGMYIRFPFFHGGRVAMRGIHYVFMIIVVAVLVWRIWYAFFSKTNADWREFAIGRKDLASAIGVLKYYGYMSNEKPHVAKYNVLQKMSYNLFLWMMFAQAFTGFALVTSPFIFGNSPRDLLVGWWLGAMVGGTDLAGWGVRTVHYVLNWLFIIMSTVHLYLAFTVDVPCALDFFGIKSMEVKPGGHGHDDHVPEPVIAPVFDAEVGSSL